MSIQLFKITVTLFSLSLSCIAKDTITITADTFEGRKDNTKDNGDKFTGNVTITTNGVRITSNLATREKRNNTDMFTIYDTVTIEKPEDNVVITAERIEVLEGRDDITISEKVCCKRDDMVFTSDVCKYNLKTNMATYNSGGTLVKPSDNITVHSRRGEADLKTTGFILSDAVEVSTEEFVIHCDMIEYKKSEDKLIAKGNIKVDIKKRKDEFITTSEQIEYHPTNKTLVAKRGIYHSSTYLLAAESLLYDQENEQLKFDDGFEMIFNNKLRFTCNKAIYDTKKKHGETYGDTVLYDMTATENKYLYLCADKFSFDITNTNNNDQEEATDELDTIQLDSLTMEEVCNEEVKEENTAPQQQPAEENKDTSVNTTSPKGTIVIEGEGKVQFCSNSFQGCSDSIRFVNNKILLPNKTILWNANNMIIGSNIVILMSMGAISKVKVLQEPLFVNIDSIGFSNQVSANMMTANVKDNNITKALFTTNVDTFYFLIRDNNLTGVNRLQCSKFFLLFNKEKLKNIYFNDKIYGNFYFPDYASNNKTQLLLDRLLQERDFIQNTSMPALEEIKKKVKTVSLISDKDLEELFKEHKKDIS
ncbi:MAG: hypothetical protein II393_04235 [Cytophagales bacterium]|nr:hypothetical protein [Cytophagales bacterium]